MNELLNNETMKGNIINSVWDKIEKQMDEAILANDLEMIAILGEVKTDLYNTLNK